MKSELKMRFFADIGIFQHECVHGIFHYLILYNIRVKWDFLIRYIMYILMLSSCIICISFFFVDIIYNDAIR